MKKYILFFIFTACLNIFAQEKKETLLIEVNQDWVKITSQNVYANCCSLFETEIRQEDQMIIITQRDTSVQKCKCMCYFDFISEFRSMPSGTYKLQVWREELIKYHYPADSLYMVSESDFTVEQVLQMPPYAYFFKQGDCDHSADIEDEMLPNGYYPEKQVSPNPVNDFGFVEIEVDEYSTGDISIHDLFGRLCFNKSNITLSRGSNRVLIETNSLQSGIYSGTLTTNNGKVYIFKFVVSK